MCTRDPKYGGLGKKALYWDTEGFFFAEGTFEIFYEYFRKRWPDLPKEPKVDVVHVKDIFELGRLFGIQFEIIQESARVSILAKFPTNLQTKIAKGKGKAVETSVQAEDWLTRAPVYETLSKKEYGLIVLDSISIPIKSYIPSTTQNLPARTSALSILLGATYPLAKNFDVAFLITNHISRNPMNPGYVYGIGDPWGGQNITYYVKHQFALYKGLKDQMEALGADGQRVRRFQRYRYPGKDVTIDAVVLAKDKGYEDMPKGVAKPASGATTE
jgi:hypothetical protein